jgi:photosystem I P700 chlorophyll a apoprotein A1
VLFARSRLIPDKANLGFRFVTALAVVVLVKLQLGTIFSFLFWMYNSLSIVIFHFSWKMQSDGYCKCRGVSQVVTSLKVLTLMVGYVISFGHKVAKLFKYGSALSAYGLIFLGAHFVLALF